MLRGVVADRSLGCEQSITRIELDSAVILASYGPLAERLADAPEPFWRHVRDALLAYQVSRDDEAGAGQSDHVSHGHLVSTPEES